MSKFEIFIAVLLGALLFAFGWLMVDVMGVWGVGVSAVVGGLAGVLFGTWIDSRETPRV